MSIIFIPKDGSKRTSHILHSSTGKRLITSRLNQSIRSITRVQYHQLTWYNSLWLWRWLSHRLSKHKSLSTTVLFRTTLTRTIIFRLLIGSIHIHNKQSNESNSPDHGASTNDKIPTSMIGAGLHNHLTKHLLNQPYVEQEATSSRTKYKRCE